MVYSTRKWMSVILLRGYDSVCNDFSCTIGNWSGKKSWTWCGGREDFEFCVAGATEILNWELNVTRVDAGSITAVVMLKLKWQRIGNGSVMRVGRSDNVWQ